jgi:hypothetical protein
MRRNTPLYRHVRKRAETCGRCAIFHICSQNIAANANAAVRNSFPFAGHTWISHIAQAAPISDSAGGLTGAGSGGSDGR